MRIAESHALLFQSKLLLLNSANHSYRRTRTRKDLKRVEHFRSELNRTEAALPRPGLDELALENGDFWLQIYADLIDCASASLDRMRSGMSSREAADRFETATPFGVARESTRSSAMSGPVLGNSRVPWPTTTGKVNRVISSTSWLSSSHRNRAPLPWTCNSRPGLAFSSRTAAATSLERTVVFAQRASVSVVDATYLGFVFKAVQIGLSPGSSHVP